METRFCLLSIWRLVSTAAEPSIEAGKQKRAPIKSFMFLNYTFENWILTDVYAKCKLHLKQGNQKTHYFKLAYLKNYNCYFILQIMSPPSARSQLFKNFITKIWKTKWRTLLLLVLRSHPVSLRRKSFQIFQTFFLSLLTLQRLNLKWKESQGQPKPTTIEQSFRVFGEQSPDKKLQQKNLKMQKMAKFWETRPSFKRFHYAEVGMALHFASPFAAAPFAGNGIWEQEPSGVQQWNLHCKTKTKQTFKKAKNEIWDVLPFLCGSRMEGKIKSHVLLQFTQGVTKMPSRTRLPSFNLTFWASQGKSSRNLEVLRDMTLGVRESRRRRLLRSPKRGMPQACKNLDFCLWTGWR